MKVLILLFIPIFFMSEDSLGQRNWSIHFGLKTVEYKGDNIQFFYRDESPDPDNFYTDIKLKGNLAYNLGGSYNNYSKLSSLYWDITGNLYAGNYFGVDLGISIGYPVFFNENKSIAILPKLTTGGGWFKRKMGVLENNTIYIQVNDTRFRDYESIELSLSGFYYFLKPNIEFIFELTQRAQIVFIVGYLFNIDLNPEVEFEGTNQWGDMANAFEKLTEPNIAFYIDNQRKNESPFKLMGPELSVGLNFKIGN